MVFEEQYRTTAELAAELDHIRSSPTDAGPLELIVYRPANFERAVVDEVELDLVHGVMGDNWLTRGSRRRPDGSANPDQQVSLMSTRVAAAVAGPRERWSIIGDQLFVDLDLSVTNLPPGTRLSIGDAVLEMTGEPHKGCAKFSKRFGPDALRFVNVGEDIVPLRLRGTFARVVEPGTIRVGDVARKL